MNLPIGPRFVYEVYGLVGQEAVVDEFGAGFHRIRNDTVQVCDMVECLIFLFEPFNDADGLFFIRLKDVYLLEASYKSFVL